MASMRRRNMDESIRRDERAVGASPGDVAARARVLSTRLRAGEINPDALALAAILGQQDAYEVVGDPYSPVRPGAGPILVFGLAPHGRMRTVRADLAFDLLVGFGSHVAAMWAFDTAFRSLEGSPDLARDTLLLNSLLQWLLNDSETNLRVVQRSRELTQQLVLPHTADGEERLRAEVIGHALATATDGIGQMSQIHSAENAARAALQAGVLAWARSSGSQEDRVLAQNREYDRQRESLAKIVMLEDQPFDELGNPRTIANPGLLVPLVPQRLNDDGAAACARSVLMHLGLNATQRDLDRRLAEDDGSQKMLAAVVRRVSRAAGVTVKTILYGGMTAEELSAHLNESRPVMIRTRPLIGAERWVVACGFDEDNAVVMDPNLEAFVPVPWRELRRPFPGVVVVRGGARAANPSGHTRWVRPAISRL